jgi:hypothetical protein
MKSAAFKTVGNFLSLKSGGLHEKHVVATWNLLFFTC